MGKKLARIEVELASLGVDCNLEGGSFMHVYEEGHAVYEAPALLLSRPAYVLIRKGWVVFPLCSFLGMPFDVPVYILLNQLFLYHLQ